MRARTPDQTVGPYFMLGLGDFCTTPAAGLPAVRGIVHDGQRQPVRDALLEISAPDAGGALTWQRVATGEDGRFAFACQPRPVPAVFTVQVFARGLLRPLLTRCYLAPPAAAADPFWLATPPARRATLLARDDPDRPGDFAWDLFLQAGDPGVPETVFFAVADNDGGDVRR